MTYYERTKLAREKDKIFKQYSAPVKNLEREIVLGKLVELLTKTNTDIYDLQNDLITIFLKKRDPYNELKLKVIRKTIENTIISQKDLINYSWWLCQYHNITENSINNYLQICLDNLGIGELTYYTETSVDQKLDRLVQLINGQQIDYTKYYRVKVGVEHIKVGHDLTDITILLYNQLKGINKILDSLDGNKLQEMIVDNLITTHRIINHIGIKIK